jgi:hypothetical protein
MSRAPGLRGALWIVVIGWAFNSGCIHNHYYGTNIPGCPPVGSAVTTQVGSVCDVPSGQVVVTGPPRSTISSNVTPQPSNISSAVTPGGPSQVVISQPAYGPPSIGQTSNRFRLWRKPDPENIPLMKAEGGLDDSTIR